MLQQFNERNRDLIVNINGRLVHRTRRNQSVRFGGPGRRRRWKGCGFTTDAFSNCTNILIACSGRPRTFLRRDPAGEKIVDEIKRTLSANKMRDGVHIRLTLTRGVKITSDDPRLNQSGPTLIILAEHKPPFTRRPGLLDHEQNPQAAAGGSRCADSSRESVELDSAQDRANNAHADDALMLDMNGFIAETNATNVFIVRKGDLATSKVVACPEGITRATVIEIAAAEKIRCVEADLSPVDVYGADEMFCTGRWRARGSG